MTITLITPEEHKQLQDIYQDYPALRLQNKGYQTIIKSTLIEENLKAWDTVEGILKKSILGFREFNNFKTNKAGEVQVRFQYNWSADDPGTIPFTGVGYLLLEELLNGFRKPTNTLEEKQL